MSAGATVGGRNRPAHLARRDACVERAAELLSSSLDEMGTAARIAHVGHVIALLESAARHAMLARGAAEPGDQEGNFLHFLELILNNVRSAHAFLKNQAHLESEEHKFLESFLGVPPDEMMLSATNYRRRSEDMVAGLWHFLRMMHVPYSALKVANLAALDATAKERYHRAYGIYREELAAKYTIPSAPPAAFSPQI